MAISANFPFWQIREEPSSKQFKEKPLNFEENLEECLLNYGQKEAPQKKYKQ